MHVNLFTTETNNLVQGSGTNAPISFPGFEMLA